MPPLPDVPNVLAIELKFTVGHANVISRVHVNYASAAPTCSRARSAQPRSSSQTWPAGAQRVASPKAGRSAHGPGLPNGAAVAALTNFKVARRYRGGKPRLYVPFFVAADLRPGLTWSESALEAGTAGWAAFMAGVLTHTPAALRLLGQVNISGAPDVSVGRVNAL
jgi:hypothetical protein